MPLEYFDCNKKEDTRLIKCDNTVYKIKILPQRSLEVGLPCSLQASHRQIEDVFRAVLYMDQRSIIIKPIHTPDFIITTEKKGWRVGRKLFFQIHGKPLKACPYQFILKVDLKTKSSVKDNAAKQSHEQRTKSCDSDTVNGSEKNKGKNSGVEEKSSKEIIETYKNIKTIKDVSNSNSDEITENIDQEKNRQIKKIRERERKKKEDARKKEGLNKLFVPTVNTSTISPNKKRKLYKAEVFCKTPTQKLYNLRHGRVTRSIASSVDGDNRSRFRKELKQPVTSKKNYAINQSPLSSEKMYECYNVKPIKRNELKQNSRSSTPPKRSGNRMSSKQKMDLQQYRRERSSPQKINVISPVPDLEIVEISSSSSSSESEHLHKMSSKQKMDRQQYRRERSSPQKIKVISPVPDLEIVELSSSSSSSESEHLHKMSSKQKMDLQQYRRERSSPQKIKVISPVPDLEIVELSSSSSSSESEHLYKSGKGRKSYPLKSRANSLSPYGTRPNKKVDDSLHFKARKSQRTGNQNNSAECSPKIDLYRPLQDLENESQRLIKLRNTSVIERGRHTSRKEIDRHEVEVEEIEESTKLQMMSKSESRSTSPRRSNRKRKKSEFRSIFDDVLQPMKRIFKG